MPAIKEDNLDIDLQTKPTETIADPVQYTDPIDMGINILSDKDDSRGPVIHYLRGYQWRVDYYNNLSGVNQKTSVCSDVLDKSVQSYNKFEDLIIYMESPISPTGDTNELTGNGVINTGLIPRVNDHFKSVMVDNRVGYFTVTEVKNKTYQYHDVYEITFRFHLFDTDDKSFGVNLESKVVEDYAYDEKYVQEYGTPMIIKSDLKDKINLRESREKLINTYFNMFIDNETCFLNPFGRDPDRHCDLLLVDGLLNKFINRTIEMNRAGTGLKYKDFDYTTNPNLYKTILDALIEKDNDYRFSIQSNLTWTYIERTATTPASRNLWYLGVNGVVDLICVDEVVVRSINEERLFQRPPAPEGVTVEYPLLLEDNKLQFYIFDQCFYEEDLTKLTKFQQVVRRFLQGEKIDHDDIVLYTTQWRYWSRYEQFYLLPILILLMKMCTLSTHGRL